MPNSDGVKNYRRICGKLLIVWGVIAAMLGVAGTLLGMMRTFNEVATASSVRTAESLSRGISASLIWTAVGAAVGLVLGVSGIAVLLLSRRNPTTEPTS